MAKWVLHSHFHRLSTYAFSVVVDNCAKKCAVKCHLVLDGQTNTVNPTVGMPRMYYYSS
jgi:hypothetical protein